MFFVIAMFVAFWVLVAYAFLGSEPIRWVGMAISLLKTRIAMRRFVKNRRSVPEEFEARVAASPHASAVSFAGREWSYSDLDDYANRVAVWALQRKKMKKGDVVAIMMGNRPEFIGVWLGLSKVGVIGALLNVNLRGRSLHHCIATTTPKAVISESCFTGSVIEMCTKLCIPCFEVAAAESPSLSLSPSATTAAGGGGGIEALDPGLSSIHISSSSSPPSSSPSKKAAAMMDSKRGESKQDRGIGGGGRRASFITSTLTAASSAIPLESELPTEGRGGYRSSSSSSSSPSSSPTSVLFYIFTSGTTGLPKAWRSPHSTASDPSISSGRRRSAITSEVDREWWCLCNGRRDCSFCDRALVIDRPCRGGENSSMFSSRESDRIYCALPLYHSAGGMIGVSMSWYAGATLILSRKFSASKFFSECCSTRATVIQYIGQICRYLVASKPSQHDRAHNVKKAVGNGMRIETWTKFQRRFGIPYIGEFYAATEGNAVLINNQSKVGAVGYVPGVADYIPFVDYPLKLIEVDPVTAVPRRGEEQLIGNTASGGRGGGGGEGRSKRSQRSTIFRPCVVCKDGEVGELISRIRNDVSASIDRRFDGYVDTSATSRKILLDVFAPGDKWFRTGDLLRRDSFGYYYFVDRIGDTYRWRGENVATTEVASVLHDCKAPTVLEGIVYGVSVPHYDGRAGMACIRLEEEDEEDDDDIDGDGDRHRQQSQERSRTPRSPPPPSSSSLRRLYLHCTRHLPPYAIPVFLRVRKGQGAMDVTSTFKHRKMGLQRDGFDPKNMSGDALLLRCDKSRSWLPLTEQRHQSILEGLVRL